MEDHTVRGRRRGSAHRRSEARGLNIGDFDSEAEERRLSSPLYHQRVSGRARAPLSGTVEFSGSSLAPTGSLTLGAGTDTGLPTTQSVPSNATPTSTPTDSSTTPSTSTSSDSQSSTYVQTSSSTSAPQSTAPSTSLGRFVSEHKLPFYAVVGGIGLLILLIIIAAGLCVRRSRKRRRTEDVARQSFVAGGVLGRGSSTRSIGKPVHMVSMDDFGSENEHQRQSKVNFADSESSQWSRGRKDSQGDGRDWAGSSSREDLAFTVPSDVSPPPRSLEAASVGLASAAKVPPSGGPREIRDQPRGPPPALTMPDPSQNSLVRSPVSPSRHDGPVSMPRAGTHPYVAAGGLNSAFAQPSGQSTEDDSDPGSPMTMTTATTHAPDYLSSRAKGQMQSQLQSATSKSSLPLAKMPMVTVTGPDVTRTKSIVGHLDSFMNLTNSTLTSPAASESVPPNATARLNNVPAVHVSHEPLSEADLETRSASPTSVYSQQPSLLGASHSPTSDSLTSLNSAIPTTRDYFQSRPVPSTSLGQQAHSVSMTQPTTSVSSDSSSYSGGVHPKKALPFALTPSPPVSTPPASAFVRTTPALPTPTPAIRVTAPPTKMTAARSAALDDLIAALDEAPPLRNTNAAHTGVKMPDASLWSAALGGSGR